MVPFIKRFFINLTSHDLGRKVFVYSNRFTGHASQHNDLSDVRERIAYRTLYESLDRTRQRRFRR